ncbi:hypothetical protein [Mycolicibacterium llatzerense]|uniref:hypothetical protein n=1 Tax=Mycolicibacterium llatzerense TaxID=280871 RepID=UPI0031D18A3A
MSDSDDPKAGGEGLVLSWAQWTRNQRIGFVAFMVFLFTVVVPVGFFAGHDPSKLISRGEVVEPGWGRNIVYVDSEEPDIHCTATTSSGELLTLAPFAGANRRKSLGSRRYATKYWAVAVLPTDRGPLHISCPSHDTVLWITAPDDNTWLYVFACLMATMTVAITVVAVVLRRRRRL